MGVLIEHFNFHLEQGFVRVTMVGTRISSIARLSGH